MSPKCSGKENMSVSEAICIGVVIALLIVAATVFALYLFYLLDTSMAPVLIDKDAPSSIVDFRRFAEATDPQERLRLAEILSEDQDGYYMFAVPAELWIEEHFGRPTRIEGNHIYWYDIGTESKLLKITIDTLASEEAVLLFEIGPDKGVGPDKDVRMNR
jgi:hypothetical protein